MANFPIDARVVYDANGQHLGGVNEQLAQIVYQVPASNGVDDTAVLQAAFDYSSQNRIVARLKPNQTYIVTKQGIKNILGIVPQTYAYQYCLLVGANATIDLNGSTIQVKSGQDASAIINKNPNLGVTPIDNNITIMNGTIDSQCSLQGYSYYQSALYLSNANNLTLKNLNVINSNIYAMYHLGLNNAYFENILIDNVNGAGFNFGGYYANCPQDGRNNNCVIKDITVKNTHQGAFYPGGSQNMGNSYYVQGNNLSFYNVKDINTYGGKYADSFSNDIYYDSMYCSGLQSIIKIQNDDGNIANSAHNVYIKNIHSVGVGDTPFLIQNSDGVYVDHVSIESPTGTSRLTYLEGDNIAIKELIIKNCSTTAETLYVRPSANVRLELVRIDNCAGQVDIQGNRTVISELIINRSDQTQLGTVVGIATNCIVKINYLEMNVPVLSSQNYINVDNGSDVTIMHLKVNENRANPSTGSTITLAAGTSTTITPINIYVKGYGRYLIPVIQLVPYNSTSRAITIQGYVPSLNQLIIKHSTAAGTEKFIMNVVKYIATDIVPSNA